MGPLSATYMSPPYGIGIDGTGGTPQISVAQGN